MRFILSIALLLALFGCGDSTAPQTADPVPAEPVAVVAAVNSPLYEFTERLARGVARVRLVAPAAGDPALWQPGAEDVLALQDADLVILNGAGYSPWTDKVSLNSNKLITTTQAAQWIALPGQVTHSHGPGGEHAHGDSAFTTWMDMSVAAAQARAIHAALVARWPNAREDLDDALAALLDELDALDRDFLAATAPLQGRPVLYSHPVYQYFERRYQLPGKSLHWEPDVPLTEAQLSMAREQLLPGTLLVWEGEPHSDSRAALSATGVTQVVIDPGANIGTQSWIALQRANIARLEALR